MKISAAQIKFDWCKKWYIKQFIEQLCQNSKVLEVTSPNNCPWCRFSHCGFTAILSLLSFPPGLDKAPRYRVRVLLGRCCLIQFFSSTNTSTNSKAAMLYTLEHRAGQRKQTNSFFMPFPLIKGVLQFFGVHVSTYGWTKGCPQTGGMRRDRGLFIMFPRQRRSKSSVAGYLY